MKHDIIKYLRCLRSHPLSAMVREVKRNEEIGTESIFTPRVKVNDMEYEYLLQQEAHPEVGRAVGSMVGLAVADSLGNQCIYVVVYVF